MKCVVVQLNGLFYITLLAPCWLSVQEVQECIENQLTNSYSKVPIIPTGPVIRTVLIFFRYFIIISTVQSQKMGIVLFIFITALPFLLYVLF